MRRILVLGTAAALLIGILVATATASVEQTVEGVDESPMTIPDGKIGDFVSYAWFYKNNESDVKTAHAESSSAGSASSSSGARADGWQSGSTEIIQIERLDQSVDRESRVHDVVVVRSNSTYDGGYAGTAVQYVELAKRSLVRSDYEADFRQVELSHTLTYSSFYAPGAGPYFEHQGKTYSLNEDVPSSDSAFDCSGTGVSLGWGGSTGVGMLPGHRSFHVGVQSYDCENEDWMPEVLSTRTWVANRGVVNGHDAYDIHTETLLRMADITATTDSEGNWQTQRGAEYDAKVVRDQWVSEDLPYVLLDETVGYRDGQEMGRSQNVLQEYRAGSTAIPWKDAPLPPVPVLEASDSAPYPEDGMGSKLPYALSQAISDATGQLSPPQFRIWRQLHADAQIVSIQMLIGEHSRSAQPSYRWSLFWASPNGDVHEVSTERITGVTQPIVTDRGDKTIPAFSTDLLPGGLVTIAEVEKAWTVLAPDVYAARGPNFVTWGLEIDSTEGLTCLGSSSASSDITPEAALRTTYVGWISEGSCAEVPEDIEASVLAFEAERGELLALLEFHDDFDLHGGPISPTQASFEPQSGAGPFTIATPDIAVATVTSSSLLAIFLVGYFLPAIKVVGAQGLLLVPGYAKLRKDAILDNKIRDQLLDTIKQDPGVSITDLSKKVDAGWGTIVYHLGVLEKNKMVSTVLDGRHRRVFPVGLVDFSSQGQLALLKNERVRALYELIHDEPGAFQDQLAKRIGISAPATSWHLKRLEDAGLVGRVKDGRRVHYYANDKPAVHDPDGMEIA
jgi:DNA-binding transcriptional ArsR family regulator